MFSLSGKRAPTTSSGKGKEKAADNKRKENEGVCIPCGNKDHCKHCSCCAPKTSSGKGSEEVIAKAGWYYINGVCIPCGNKDHCKHCSCCAPKTSSGKGSEEVIAKAGWYYINGVCFSCAKKVHCKHCLCCCPSTQSSGEGSEKEEKVVEKIVRCYINEDSICSPCRDGKYCNKGLCCAGQIKFDGLTRTTKNAFSIKNPYWLEFEKEEEKKKKY